MNLIDNEYIVFFNCKEKSDVEFRFKQLAKLVHPDVSKEPNAADLFSRLKELRQLVLSQLEAGTWNAGSIFIGKYSFLPLNIRKFENGTEYYIKNGVVYDFNTRELASKVNSILSGFESISDLVLKKKVMYSFPEKHYHSDKTVIIARAQKEVPASLFSTKVDHRSTAWIMTSLLNACCFLQSQRVVHGAISPSNILLNLDKHSVRIVGGWEFHTRVNSDIKFIPGWVYRNLPKSCVADKKSKFRIDTEASKSIIREMIRGTSSVPNPVRRWLDSPCAEDSRETFSSWEKVRDSCYKREFIKCDESPLTMEKYYG